MYVRIDLKSQKKYSGECVKFVPFPLANDNLIDDTTIEISIDNRRSWCEDIGVTGDDCNNVVVIVTTWCTQNNISDDCSPTIFCHFNPDQCSVTIGSDGEKVCRLTI